MAHLLNGYQHFANLLNLAQIIIAFNYTYTSPQVVFLKTTRIYAMSTIPKKYSIIIQILLLSACARLTILPQTPIKISLAGNNTLNPDNRNHSLPVLVRLYQLKSDKAFLKASFKQLWQEEQITLSQDLLSKEEITLAPGTKRRIKLKRQANVKYIAVMALFRNPPKKKQWRLSRAVPYQVTNLIKPLLIKLSGNRLYENS